MVIIKIIIDKNKPIGKFIVGPGTDHWSKARDKRLALLAGAWLVRLVGAGVCQRQLWIFRSARAMSVHRAPIFKTYSQLSIKGIKQLLIISKTYHLFLVNI